VNLTLASLTPLAIILPFLGAAVAFC